MRKYYQATLLLIAVVSIISLLFYRHEYNKLRYVLEVFNYFGKPGEKEEPVDNCTKNDLRPERNNLDFDEPFASWQRLNNDLFVYSSYSKQQKVVITIGFGKLRNNLKLNCNIYLDEENRVAPGNFSYSIVENTTDVIENSKYCGYILRCEHFGKGNPASVIYYQAKGDIKTGLILSIKQLSDPLEVNNYAFCVTPSENPMLTLSEMTNFLDIQKSIGVDDFIVYDYGIPGASNKVFKNPEKYGYTKIPWNFPFLNARLHTKKKIIQLDCLYRTYGKAMYAGVLSWGEYIVLNYHTSLNNLMADFKKNKMFGHRFMLNSEITCIQEDNSKYKENSTIILKQESSSKNQSVLLFKPHEILHAEYVKTMEILPDLVTVKRFEICNIARDNAKPKLLNFRKSFKFAGDA